MVDPMEFLDFSLTEISEIIRTRKASPVEITKAALSRADQLQPILNSFITILHDGAMESAHQAEEALMKGEYKGPLHGVPIGIKDNIATAGVKTTVGSKVFKSHIPKEDAHVVTLCKKAGGIIIGKENLDEFAGGGTSMNPHYGAVHNPWSLDCIPGGSSGGGGANVASCITFASLGTDLGGSVRLPGAFCGIVGLKQTYGRVSQRGLMVTSFNGDHIGPLTRTAQDSALMLGIISDYDRLDPSSLPVAVGDYTADIDKSLRGLTMGIPSNYYLDLIDPEVETAFFEACSALEGLGVKTKKIELPSMEYAGTLRVISMADRIVTHEPYIKSHRQDYGDHVLYSSLTGQFILARDYVKAMKVQRLITQDHLNAFEDVDFLVMPTVPLPAPKISSPTFNLAGTDYPMIGPAALMISKNTFPSNATGQPAITVPCGFANSGLPIGLQLVGRPFDESLLIRVAHAYGLISPANMHPAPAYDGKARKSS